MDKIKDKMNQVAEGRLDVRINAQERGKGEFAEIADSFNYMVDRLEKQVEEIRAMDRKKHLLELDFLQAQINPHFIYNTLSSIRFYVEMGKNEEAEDMLIDFSKILRKTLSRTEQFITLREEMETLRHYVNLQKARYRERVEVWFDVEESTLSSLVPDFILQPIVENCFKHGFGENGFPWMIHVAVTASDGHWKIHVRNNGRPFQERDLKELNEKVEGFLKGEQKKISGIGLTNTIIRLRLLYEERVEYEIYTGSDGYTCVVLKGNYK